MGVSRVFRKAALISALGLAPGGCADGSAYSPQRDPVSLSDRAAALPQEPLGRAYAHNDYAHKVPLFDALGNGFAAVEADIFLRGEGLLVAHTVFGLDASRRLDRRLDTLYLDPLMELTRHNGGQVYARPGESFLLLIDIKSGGNKTYLALREKLRDYRAMLTSFSDGGVCPGAVTVVLSGNRPDRGVLEGEAVRYAAYDGRLSDLRKGLSAAIAPVISADWGREFSWRGHGPMPARERRKLADIVETAHARGQQVRFWNTPDVGPGRAAVWRVLLDADVDYINTDRPSELRKWLVRNDNAPTRRMRGPQGPCL